MADEKSAVQRLEGLLKEIEQAKSERDQEVGKRDGLLERLEQEFDVGSIDEAENLLSDLESELEEDEKRLEEGMNELAEKYEW